MLKTIASGAMRVARGFLLVAEKSTLDLRTANQTLRRYDGESIALRVSGIRSSLDARPTKKSSAERDIDGFSPAESIFPGAANSRRGGGAAGSRSLDSF